VNSVIALSKLYDLADPRLSHVLVKGDLIMPTSNRIMTRSRARQQPDQFTIIPAPVKIVKVLIEELHSAAGGSNPSNPQLAGSSGASAIDGVEAESSLAEAGGSDDGDEWEDDEDTLDLATGMTKQELMAFGEDGPPGSASRMRDDETQNYLIEFFRRAAQGQGFAEVFGALTEDERGKLRAFG